MPDIQEILLHFVGALLGHKFEEGKDKDNRLRRSFSVSSLQINQELNKNEKTEDTEVIALALKTLGSFKFTTNTNVRSFDTIIRDLLQNCVINYLSNDNSTIRKEAALTSSALLVATNAARGGSSLFSDVLDKLLILGISDRDDSIRRAVMAALDKKFDQLLAQPENLSSLFLALNDEVFEVRELAITVIGRLTTRNPAYVMPSLRKTLIQLLGDLEFSGDSRNKEESAKLLAHLIRSSHRLLAPYEDSILKTLLPKLREGDSHVASSVLIALGELSLAGGERIL
jgi:FKBP12-rapamycin complex-associated protein